jgi:hypothetical protein
MQYKAVLLADASKHDHVKGTLTLGISVYVGDWYVYGGTLYECILAHISASPGNVPPNTTYWTPVVSAGTPLGSVSWKGAWSSGTTYAAGDGCTLSGHAYVSIVGSNLNHSPPNVTYWVEVYYSAATGTVVGPGSSTASNVAEFDGATGQLLKDGALTHANVADAITKKHTQATDDNFNTLTEKTAFVDADPALIYSVADAAYRKMQLGNLKKMVVCWVGDSSTAQTLTTGVQTKIAAGYAASAAIDTLSGWDGTNKKYVCKEAGFYLIWAQTMYAANGTGLRYIAVYVNSSWIEIVDTGAFAAGAWQQVQGWMGLALNVNDVIEIGVDQTSGGNLNIQWGNRFLIIKVA